MTEAGLKVGGQALFAVYYKKVVVYVEKFFLEPHHRPLFSAFHPVKAAYFLLKKGDYFIFHTKLGIHQKESQMR